MNEEKLNDTNLKTTKRTKTNLLNKDDAIRPNRY